MIASRKIEFRLFDACRMTCVVFSDARRHCCLFQSGATAGAAQNSRGAQIGAKLSHSGGGGAAVGAAIVKRYLCARVEHVPRDVLLCNSRPLSKCIYEQISSIVCWYA